MSSPVTNSGPGRLDRPWCARGSHYWWRLPTSAACPDSCPDHAHKAAKTHPAEPRFTNRSAMPVQRPAAAAAAQAGEGEDLRVRRGALPTSGRLGGTEGQGDFVRLWCEEGHYWSRPRLHGRRPLRCPEHAPAREIPHPSTNPATFRLDFGWSLRLSISPRLRRASRVPVPESLVAAAGLAPQQILDVVPDDRGGPVLTLWRGQGRAGCRGRFDQLIPSDAADGDWLFISFDLPRYRLQLSRGTATADPAARLSALVGLPPDAAAGPAFWHHVSRRLGVATSEPDALRVVADKRRDRALREAVSAAATAIRPVTEWGPEWDLGSDLHPDQRYLAVTNGRRCRVAVGVADPRDRLPDHVLVTPGGLVWVEVGQPDEARAARASLAPDIVAPVLSDRWVSWMRLEHLVRRVSLAGQQWRLLVDGQSGWRLEGTGAVGDLRAVLAVVGGRETGIVRDGRHVRHTIPRAAGAIERALRRATVGGLHALESDSEAGFASCWTSGTSLASSLLGALLP